MWFNAVKEILRGRYKQNYILLDNSVGQFKFKKGNLTERGQHTSQFPIIF